MSGAHRTFGWKIEDVHVALREVSRDFFIFSHQQEQNKRWQEVDNFAWKWSTILLFVVALVSVALLKALTSRRTWRFLSDCWWGRPQGHIKVWRTSLIFFKDFQVSFNSMIIIITLYFIERKNLSKKTQVEISALHPKKRARLFQSFSRPGYEAPDVQRLRMSQRPFESWFGTRSRRRQNVTSVIFLGGKRWNNTGDSFEKRYSRMQYLP